MKHGMFFRLIVSIVVLVAAPVGSIQALEKFPEEITSPVREQWRVPFGRFLAQLGVDEVDKTINASKATEFPEIPVDSGSGLIVFRIVHPRACSTDQDLCLTVIGRIEGETLKAEASVMAGKRINLSDTTPNIIGVETGRAVRFFSKNMVIGVVKSKQGLVVSVYPSRVSSAICSEATLACRAPCETWAKSQPDYDFSLKSCIANCESQSSCQR